MKSRGAFDSFKLERGWLIGWLALEMIAGIHKYEEKHSRFLSLHCAFRDNGDVVWPNFGDESIERIVGVIWYLKRYHLAKLLLYTSSFTIKIRKNKYKLILPSLSINTAFFPFSSFTHLFEISCNCSHFLLMFSIFSTSFKISFAFSMVFFWSSFSATFLSNFIHQRSSLPLSLLICKRYYRFTTFCSSFSLVIVDLIWFFHEHHDKWYYLLGLFFG